MCCLVTRVGAYGLLPELDSHQELAAIAISFGEVLECLQVQFLQVAAFRKEPFTVEIVLEEWPAVQVGTAERQALIALWVLPAWRARWASRVIERNSPRSVQHLSAGLSR